MDNYLTDFDLELFVTTSRTTTVNVEVTSPKWTSPSVNEQFTVTAGVVKQLFIDLTLRLEGTVKESKGIRVSADDEVVIYGVNKQWYSNDAFLGLPVDVLSDEYFAVTYYPPYRMTQLCVVGVTDSTNVQIKLPSCSNCGSVTYNGKTYSKGKTISVNMNSYDAIQLQSTGDLTGAYITSDKPVSAFSGNRKTNTGSGGSQDHLVEHLTPVNTWGKRFATVPTPARTTGDYFKFIASEDSTQVTYKCNKNGQISTNSFTLSNLGDQNQISIDSNNYCYITADKPIFLVMIVKSQISSAEPADPSMLIIPPIEQYAADYTFTTPKYSQGNTDLVGGYISISDGSHTVRHTSPISIFGGFLYGKAHYETYGFTTGMRMAKINSICVPTSTVVGDGIDNDCDGLIDEELCTTENQNKDDDGDGVTEEDCAKPPPINGAWADWASWGSCSVSCNPSGSSASGTYTRTRTCSNPEPKYDGTQCVGDTSQSSSCSPTIYCPINGNWGSWGSYGSCSVSCGTGDKTKTRSCNNPAPVHNGNQCSGSGTSSKSCTMIACPVDGQWGSWASWGTCSVTCASGTETRQRQCDSPAPQHNGQSCSGSGTETKTCTKVSCPVDGQWGSWVSWGSCSVTCASGTQNRQRQCDSPAQQHNGLDCVGSGTDTKTCTKVACPVNGNWGNWASWGSCTVTCASGTQSRQRQCDQPAPQHNGQNCGGSNTDTQICTQIACPIDGNWGSWDSWGSCSVTCASGTQNRQRQCDNPAAQHNGQDCSGSGTDTQTCTRVPCPIDGLWAVWSAWGTCSVTCASGTHDRSRTCTDPAPAHNGADCVGSGAATQTCTLTPCPIDGEWTTWTSWGTCTVTCGGGAQDRTRSCTNPAPQYNGAACAGNGLETQSCNTQVCIIDGAWGQWQSWGVCSVTCGGGRQSRMRVCDDPRPANGGLHCSGSSSEYGYCNTQACPTAAYGAYVQTCPTGWFSCQHGSVSCIDEAFKCDCEEDCEDGSDETTSYASCNPHILATCPSGADSK
ncbi:Adhesion G protein-coupled receptor B2,Coadhesin,Thrombospondin-1,Mucin-like protein,Hemicentin-1,Adhesion G protein-coupled receptor B3,Thrombospondin-2 [Mytilus coruscus]|uniref:Adhesion G protein-coupled receptor B2,Coadhesin,Thrombospondin-1,Mucin-like protein,Hemicentin-1,Adhesion G protein-coupled receptor B3,Thrombospondin-2 n=1 Tax=Mytilus coruscus TaxID=42192 RepID=A0A6J8EAK1_MYTCO|nr:Adhesion G protein-coupled receptor B2,Coadhesin,Thrombospondin-1,Mucin-like protein,Hemicentin-1,Adhesion G protein-coupled receptor B3,Thrombospondin-2 [Mytilus coruscus]